MFNDMFQDDLAEEYNFLAYAKEMGLELEWISTFLSDYASATSSVRESIQHANREWDL